MAADMELLRELQLVNLRTLKKLDEVCRKYDIRYWAAFGTLIGAIRHKGFIPWDDDLDVCMMREDFEKLCKVPEEEWGPDCCFCSPSSPEEYHDRFFGRVYIKDSQIQSYVDVENWRNWSDGKSWSTKMMCDIFVWDYVPDDDAEYEKLHDQLKEIEHKDYKWVKCKAYTASRNPLKIAKTAAKIARGSYLRSKYKEPWKYLDWKVQNIIRQHPAGDRIGCYNTYLHHIYEYDDVFPLTTAQFEDMEVPVPAKWDKLLTQDYGDYMTPPPESDRVHINFLYMDMGDGRKYVLDPVKGSLGDPNR